MLGHSRRRRSGPRCAHPVAVAPPPTSHLPMHEVVEPIVRALFPEVSKWHDLSVEVILTGFRDEVHRFIGDDGVEATEMIYWAMVEADSPDSEIAARWRRFKAPSPSPILIPRPHTTPLIPPGN